MAKEKNHWSYENEDIPNCEIIAISSPPPPHPTKIFHSKISDSLEEA